MAKKIFLLVIFLNCASAQLLVNEIMYNPSREQGSDSYNEWVELYNPTNTSINIRNWTLCNDKLLPGYIERTTSRIQLNLTDTIPARGYALITDGGSGTEAYGNFNINPNSIALHTNTSSVCNNLNNKFNEIFLKNQENSLIDHVNYSNTWGADGDGKTLERTRNNKWGASKTQDGTPGAENSIATDTTTPTTSTTTTTSTLTSTTSTSTTLYCVGCVVDGVCISSGVRTADSYCSLEGVMKSQLDDNVECLDNYECRSNFCTDDVCRDIYQSLGENRDLLQRILDLLNTFFEWILE